MVRPHPPVFNQFSLDFDSTPEFVDENKDW